MPIVLAYVIGGVASALMMLIRGGGITPGLALLGVSIVAPLASASVRTAITRKEGVRRVFGVVIGIGAAVMAVFLGKDCSMWLVMVTVNGQIWAAVGLLLGLLVGSPQREPA
jgi:hypothetical protein